MGRVRRSGFIIEWFIGDHEPLHIHVYDAKGSFLGRLDLKTMIGVEGWIPSRKLRDLVQKLKIEGIL